MCENPEGVSSPQTEGPFSALTPSMYPSTSAIHQNKSGSEEDEDDKECDEFGFRLEVEDGPEDCSNKLLSAPFQDDGPQRRLQWIAHLEFSAGEGETLAWDTLVENIQRTEKLR